MPEPSTLCLDRVLVSRQQPGDRDRAAGIQDANKAAQEKLLDELFNRPQGTTAEETKLQVIRDSKHREKPADKTPEQMAEGLKARAERRLANAHRDLTFTDDRFEPKTMQFRTGVKVTGDSSAMDLARQELGGTAKKEQLETYAGMLMKVNGLTGNLDEALIKDGDQVSLPGQRSDGGVFYRHQGKTVVEWHDGSKMEHSERGVGFASYKEKDGTDVRFDWSPDSADDNMETRIKDDNKKESWPSGEVADYVRVGKDWKMTRQTARDDKDRHLELSYDPAAKGNAPKSIRITDKDKNVMELEADTPGMYKGTKKNSKGEVVDDDLRLKVERNGIVIWSQKTNAADKTWTKSFESGTVETFNEKNQLLKRQGKDSWSRNVVEEYQAGKGLPDNITVTMKDGKPVKFDLKPFGSYQADYLNDKGEKIGNIELKANGLVLYVNDRQQTAHADLPDGSTIERTHFANGRQEIKQSKDGNVLTKQLDREGTVLQAEYSAKDGRKITRRTAADGQSIEGITIEDPQGARTELKYDRDAGQFSGTRKNKAGEDVEKVFYMQGKLVYTDVNNPNSTRFERLNVFERDLFGVKLSAGKYEAATGTLSYKNADGSTTVESFAPGRTDVIRNGVTRGTTVTGERSQIKKDGEAVVNHADDTGVRLNTNNTIDRWGPEKADNSLGEPLTRTESNFMRDHADIDRRAVAEIHRQFGNNPAMLDNFYKELSEIDKIKDMTDAEKSGLRRGLMHHVANPAELYQGNSWCCNVATIERELAMNMPDRYAKTVIDALSKGEVTLADGSKIPVRDCNLKQPDTTGRDMPTRVFHSVALQVRYYPQYNFRNTEDGAGRLLPAPGSPDAPAAFMGMDMDEIVQTRHKLTGENKALVNVNTVDDIVKAFEANGSRSMIIAVNAGEPPFSDNGLAALFGGGQTESRPNHVVSITKVDAGPPVKFHVQNQWGLKEDLSSPAKAVEGSVLLGSMVGRVKSRVGGGMVKTPAQVLSAGDPKKSYTVKDGKLVEDKK